SPRPRPPVRGRLRRAHPEAAHARSPQHAAVDIRNAYEAKDRDAHDRALARLVAMVSLGPVIERMTPAQLEVRRAELQGQIERVEKHIARNDGARAPLVQPPHDPIPFG
ncbi:hypothetical protein, partial [Ramlibacter sp.]|uniref:hypothetical protein n=1 Tax=Ramlibacter sp. TaxID=1917967 RepID=UPI003D0A497A